MIYERNSYKSWSNLKKQLQELLCDKLKSDISYYYTSYRELHNVYGRASINYRKKEVVTFSWDLGLAQWNDEYAILRDNNTNLQALGSYQAVQDNQKHIHDDLMKTKWMIEGTLCEDDFIHAATTYLKTDVATALHSDNYLLRIFAYMDRRVGKRTLLKIKDEVEALPEWVKQFYRIRCEADGVVFPPRRTTNE